MENKIKIIVRVAAGVNQRNALTPLLFCKYMNEFMFFAHLLDTLHVCYHKLYAWLLINCSYSESTSLLHLSLHYDTIFTAILYMYMN